MDELMRKITEKLNIAIDKAPEVYEMLKWQHVIYDTVNYINSILYILAFITIPAEMFFAMYIFENHKVNVKYILLLIAPIISIILLIIILLVYRNINAPDVLFLKEVLRG